MIYDLDRTLAELLKLELPNLFGSEAVTPVTISFETPDSEFVNQVTLPAVDFFLYDIRENLEFRQGGYAIERQNNGTAVKQMPPARIDCSYLITVWASQSDRPASQREHYLLGEVMQVLLRHRQIPEAIMQGNLRGKEPPLRAISLQQSNLQSLGEFWQAMGGKPKAALNYTVTMPIAIHQPVAAGRFLS